MGMVSFFRLDSAVASCLNFTFVVSAPGESRDLAVSVGCLLHGLTHPHFRALGGLWLQKRLTPSPPYCLVSGSFGGTNHTTRRVSVPPSAPGSGTKSSRPRISSSSSQARGVRLLDEFGGVRRGRLGGVVFWTKSGVVNFTCLFDNTSLQF